MVYPYFSDTWFCLTVAAATPGNAQRWFRPLLDSIAARYASRKQVRVITHPVKAASIHDVLFCVKREVRPSPPVSYREAGLKVSII